MKRNIILLAGLLVMLIWLVPIESKSQSYNFSHLFLGSEDLEHTIFESKTFMDLDLHLRLDTPDPMADTVVYTLEHFNALVNPGYSIPSTEDVVKAVVGSIIRKLGAYCDTKEYIIYLPTCYMPDVVHTLDTTLYQGDEYSRQYDCVYSLDMFDGSQSFDEFYFKPQYVNGLIILNDFTYTQSPLPCGGLNANYILNTFQKNVPDIDINPSGSFIAQGGELCGKFSRTNVMLHYYDETSGVTVQYEPVWSWGIKYSSNLDSIEYCLNLRAPLMPDTDYSLVSQIDKQDWFTELMKIGIVDLVTGEINLGKGFHDIKIRLPDIEFTGSGTYYNSDLYDEILITVENKEDHYVISNATDICTGNTDYKPSTTSLITGEALVSGILSTEYQSNISNSEWNDPLTRTVENLLVGSIQGRHSVTTNGAFTYSIPIGMAEGTNGMTPKVSLNYSSNSGSGIAGYGWSLNAGISVITRGGYSLNQDNISLDVKYNSTDKFYYNGMELVLKSGTYGADGSVYVPKSGTEDYTVTYYTTDSYQNCENCNYFIVHYKNGTIMELGRRVNCRNIKIMRKGVYACDQNQINDTVADTWYIDKIIDKNGNYIQYNYLKTETREKGYNFEVEPMQIKSIAYTGHYSSYSASDPNACIINELPRASVEFIYSDRLDQSLSFSFGSMIYNKFRLDKIYLKMIDATYKQYKLEYEYQNQSYLREITLYGKNNAHYNSTIFNYDNESFVSNGATAELKVNKLNVTPLSTLSDPDNYEQRILFGDFNADGIKDRVIVKIKKEEDGINDSQWDLQYGSLSSSGITYTSVSVTPLCITGGLTENTASCSTSTILDMDHVRIMDLDNDGYDEILVPGYRYDNTQGQMLMFIQLVLVDKDSGELFQRVDENNINRPLLDNLVVYNSDYELKTIVSNPNESFRLSFQLEDYDGDGFMEMIIPFKTDAPQIKRVGAIYYFDIVEKDNIGNFECTGEGQFSDRIIYFKDDDFLNRNYHGDHHNDNYFTVLPAGKVDGKAALFIKYLPQGHPKTEKVWVQKDGLTFEYQFIPGSNDAFVPGSLSGDFNGDGYIDYYSPESGFIFNDGKFNYSYGSFPLPNDYYSFFRENVDYDKPGFSNLIDSRTYTDTYPSANFHTINDYQPACTQGIMPDPIQTYNDTYYYVGDFNGDGKDDILDYTILHINDGVTNKQYTASIYTLVTSTGIGTGNIIRKAFLHKRVNNNSVDFLDWDYYISPGDWEKAMKIKGMELRDDKLSKTTTGIKGLTEKRRAGIYLPKSNKYISFFNEDQVYSMTDIFDGYNNKLEISYENTNSPNQTCYTINKTGHSYEVPGYESRLRYLGLGLDVVTSVKSIQAQGQQDLSSEVKYFYEDGIFDRLGGFLGFKKVITETANPHNPGTPLRNEIIKTIKSFDPNTELNNKLVSFGDSFSKDLVFMLVKDSIRDNYVEVNGYPTEGSQTVYKYDTNLLIEKVYHSGQNKTYGYIAKPTSVRTYNYNLGTGKQTEITLDSKGRVQEIYKANHWLDGNNQFQVGRNAVTKVSHEKVTKTYYDDEFERVKMVETETVHEDDKEENGDLKTKKTYTLYSYDVLDEEANTGNQLHPLISTSVYHNVNYDGTNNEFTTAQTFYYDDWGHITKEVLSDKSHLSDTLQPQITNITYSTGIGHRPKAFTDNSQITTYKQIDRFGKLRYEVDANNDTTRYSYDDMGKRYRTQYPNGIIKYVTTKWGNVGCPQIGPSIYPKYYFKTFIDRGTEEDVYAYSYFDSWNRNVVNQIEMMSANNSSSTNYGSRYTHTEYLSNGQIDTEYELNTSNQHLLFPNTGNRTEYSYDTKGRLSSKKSIRDLPTDIENEISIEYDGLTTTTKYMDFRGLLNREKSRTVDAAGLFEESIDTDGNKVRATYYANGLVHTMTTVQAGSSPEKTSTVTFEYDDIGRKTKMIDPNAGIITYKYNVYGQLTEQIHEGKGRTKYYYFDDDTDTQYNGKLKRINRFIATENADGSFSYSKIESQTKYTYVPNNANYGKGLVSEITHEYKYGSINDDIGQKITYTYGEHGLLTSKTEKIYTDWNTNDQLATYKEFTYDYTYDDFWRLRTQTMPEINAQNDERLKIRYTYNKLDEIIQIDKEINASTFEPIWKLTDVDIYGKPTKVELNTLLTEFEYDEMELLKRKETTLGSSTLIEKWNYTWNAYTGNLEQRKYQNSDMTFDIVEYFHYDDLDRLQTTSDIVNTLTLPPYMAYEDYPNPDDLDWSITNGDDYGHISHKEKVGDFHYDDCETADDAVRRIDFDTQNTTSEINQETQKLTYTSFNSVETIEECVNGEYYYKEIYYGYNGQRILMRSFSKEEENGTYSAYEDKYYAENFEYTEHLIAPPINKEVAYVFAPTGLTAAQVTYKESSVVTENFYHILTDHLGSITNLILHDQSGIQSIAQFTYDSWGRPRQIVNGAYSYDIDKSDFDILDRGYTGHEHLLDHNIINMNGRIYDPILGQFMQPDNYIQTPEDYLGYDRYTYCRGNPFKWVDPTGERFDDSGFWQSMSANTDFNRFVETFNRFFDAYQARCDAMFDAYNARVKASMAESMDYGGGSGGGAGRNTGSIDVEKKKNNNSWIRRFWNNITGKKDDVDKDTEAGANGEGRAYIVKWNKVKYIGRSGIQDKDIFYSVNVWGRKTASYTVSSDLVIGYENTQNHAMFAIKGDFEAKGLFEFLVNNSNVEWGIQYTRGRASGANFIVSTYHTSSVNFESSIFTSTIRSEGLFRYIIHSHPYGDHNGLNPVDFAFAYNNQTDMSQFFAVYIHRDGYDRAGYYWYNWHGRIGNWGREKYKYDSKIKEIIRGKSK